MNQRTTQIRINVKTRNLFKLVADCICSNYIHSSKSSTIQSSSKECSQKRNCFCCHECMLPTQHLVGPKVMIFIHQSTGIKLFPHTGSSACNRAAKLKVRSGRDPLHKKRGTNEDQRPSLFQANKV